MPPGMPTAIARYQVRELLGEGTFGSVYRAFDPQLEREIALKVLRPEMTASAQAVERFLREARAAAKLHHPHIVPVHDAGRAGSVYYIASAYIAGRTLALAIPEGGVEPRRAAEWAAQLASALGYAHRRGVLHRDVKPANAMLDEEESLQLMDFGLAAWTREETTRLTMTGAVMGTPAYMSPEQACGDTAEVGPHSDLYSAGVVLYQMLTGRPPFEAPHTAALVYRIVHTDAPPPSQVSPGLDAALEVICLKAMAKLPSDRFASGDAMAATLRGWMGGRTPRESEIETLLPPPPRRVTPPPIPPIPPTAPTGRTAVRPAPRPAPLRRSSSGAGVALLGGALAFLLVGATCAGGLYLYSLSPPPPSTGLANRITPPPPATTDGPKPPAATTGAPPPPPPPATTGAPPPIPPAKDKDKPAIPVLPARAVAPFDEAKATQLQQEWADYLGVPVVREVDLGGGATMKMTLIPPGTFLMGSPPGETGQYDDETPQHPVEITQPFYIGTYTVTKGQYAAFVADDGYQTEAEKANEKETWRDAGFAQTDDSPAVVLTWNDAAKFCEWLSKKEDKTYEISPEAEWEYACRAGTTTAYSFGDDAADLGDYAWFEDNADNQTHPVGTKKPNPWGLYDMHGNVRHWCADWSGKYTAGSVKDPRGPDSGDARVLRGGCWGYGPRNCRSAFRFEFTPDYRVSDIGFRVVQRLSVKAP